MAGHSEDRSVKSEFDSHPQNQYIKGAILLFRWGGSIPLVIYKTTRDRAYIRSKPNVVPQKDGYANLHTRYLISSNVFCL